MEQTILNNSISKPYKSFVAQVFFAVGGVTTTVLQNELAIAVVATRESVGNYRFTSADIVENKTVVYFTRGNCGNITGPIQVTPRSGYVGIQSYANLSDTLTDIHSEDGVSSIEIRVYN